MIRRITVLLALSAASLALLAAPAAAAPAGKPDTKCLQAGIAFLQANGGVAYFAQNGVPLAVIGGEGTLPLADVFQLHLRSPQLFPWCAAG
jgi:hypothetical protein